MQHDNVWTLCFNYGSRNCLVDLLSTFQKVDLWSTFEKCTILRENNCFLTGWNKKPCIPIPIRGIANVLISLAIKLSYLTSIVILQGHRVMFREPYFFLWEEVALGAICVFVLEIRENQPEIEYKFSLKSTYSARTSSTNICHLLLLLWGVIKKLRHIHQLSKIE